MPQFGPWVSPTFENGFHQYFNLGGCGIIEMVLLVTIEYRIAGFGSFDSTEEGVAHKGWDNVDTAGKFPQIVDHDCCCRGSIWKMKHSR